jgi:ABC-type multidrug transport system ATPase subunit
MNLKLYQGQIFALLGQNGAGKTTTISMLTGLLVPSAGQVTLNHLDLLSDLQARRMMGVCPQHDVLFDLLTPREHLDLFYELKGATSEKSNEIHDMIQDVGLSLDEDNLA